MYTMMPMAPIMAPRPRLAEAYVPYQQSIDPSYCPEEALEKGTMFVDLYSPYEKTEGKMRRMDCCDYDV